MRKLRLAGARLLSIVLLTSLIAACSLPATSDPAPTKTSGTNTPEPTSAVFGDPTSTPIRVSPTPAAGTSSSGAADIRIDAGAAGVPIDPRLRGTNIPAWANADGRATFDDPSFLARLKHSGTTVLRLPGGSWGNFYDWLGCETKNAQKGTADGCYWTWAARPTDFANLLKKSGQPGMWIISAQGTAQSAAALVAFFNGDVNDKRPIGVDRNGRDWLTIGDWAKLRSKNGNPAPQKILLWEIGNEIYGAKQSTGGSECSPYGWEEVWTCDGTKYVQGDAKHDGFLAFQSAMKQVDPDIKIGAVGVAKQGDWNDWGNKVIAAAGKQMDFYVIHNYAYSSETSDYAGVLAQPQKTWKPMMANVQKAFAQLGDDKPMPVAVTEYNLFAFRELDTNGLMTQSVNALYTADTLGQFATQGFTMANQYALTNGDDGSGTRDLYGMLTTKAFVRSPQYYAFWFWSRFGTKLLPLNSRFDPAKTLSAYAGRNTDGSLTIMAINKTDVSVDAVIQIDGVPALTSGTVDVLQTTALGSEEITVNGVSNPADDMSNAPPTALGKLTAPLTYRFAPYSITLLRLGGPTR